MNAIAQVLELSPDIAVYTPFRTELAAFKANNAKLIFDYEDPKGNKEARSHVAKLRSSKAAVDKARLAETAHLRALKSRIDEEGKEIIAEIEAMISVHAGPLEEIEQREKNRIASIKSTIRHIEDCGNGAIGGEVQPFPILFHELEEKIIIDDSFGEFELEARKCKDMALARLKNAFAQHQEREAERAELERLRAEAAKRERVAEDERLKQVAAEAARLEAERRAAADQQAAERKAQAEREAAEKRELELKLQAERAEREKVEAEARVLKAAQDEREQLERVAAAKAAEDAKREANKKHRERVHAAVASAMVAAGVSKAAAETVIEAVRNGAIPNLSISY